MKAKPTGPPIRCPSCESWAFIDDGDRLRRWVRYICMSCGDAYRLRRLIPEVPKSMSDVEWRKASRGGALDRLMYKTLVDVFSREEQVKKMRRILENGWLEVLEEKPLP